MFKYRKGLFISLLIGLTLISSLAEATVPNAPGNYVGASKLSSTSVRISTKDNSDNEDGFYVLVYDYETSVLVQKKQISDSNNSYIYADFTGLVCDKLYSANVLAFNEDGNSSVSDTRHFNIHTTFSTICPKNIDVPSAPGSYIGVTDINKSAVRVNFLDNSDNEDGFVLFDESGDINVTIPKNNEIAPSQTYVTLTGLTSDRTYTIRALAFNSNGNSATSDARTFNIHSTFEVTCDDATAITREALMEKIGKGEDVTQVNTCKITDMNNLFNQFAYPKAKRETVKNFNQDISGWDTSNVTNMSNMFYFAESFNQPLESWDVSSVTNMNYMFESAESFNQPLESWDVSSVTTMVSMFNGAKSFNKSLNGWDVSNVSDMVAMFASAESFNQPLYNWDTSSVNFMVAMFAIAESFNQPLNNWDVSNVRDMTGMFYSAKSFNQDIRYWDVSNVKDHDDFAKGAPLKDIYNPFISAKIISDSIHIFIPKKTLKIGETILIDAYVSDLITRTSCGSSVGSHSWGESDNLGTFDDSMFETGHFICYGYRASTSYTALEKGNTILKLFANGGEEDINITIVAPNYTKDSIKKITVDNITGLMWQDNNTIKKPWSEGTLFREFDTSGDTATTYCSNLNWGGYDDWRIPSIGELSSYIFTTEEEHWASAKGSDLSYIIPAITSKLTRNWSNPDLLVKCVRDIKH